MRAAAERGIGKDDAARLRRRCQQLIAFAEQLKVQLTASPASPPTDGLSILRGASRLHGSYYPPWSDDPPDAQFQLGPDLAPYV